MIRTEIAAQAAQALHTTHLTYLTNAAQVQTQAAAHAGPATTARVNYASALPGEWLMLWVLVVMAAALGAAVLAGGAVRQRRLEAVRVEQWREWCRRRAEQGERPGGRECG